MNESGHKSFKLKIYGEKILVTLPGSKVGH